MLRLYDFECVCGHIHEELVSVDADETPRQSYPLDCPKCKSAAIGHKRLPPLIAKYMGEKPLSPRVAGGSFDTMGHKKPKTKLPQFPENGSYSDFKDHRRTPEFREAKRERLALMRENKTKRARATAARRDPNLSFRHNPVSGDPNWKS
jgi:hypothetical protein